MMKTNVLYIEDDQDIGAWTHQYLEERNYAVVWLRSGEGLWKQPVRANS